MKELNERINMPRLHSANWKRNLTSTVFSLVGLIVIVFFAQRAMLSRYRHVAGSHNNQRSASVVDGCTFAQNDGESRFHDPPETNCCMYDDEVGLRIIILTFNRPASLLSLLRSMDDLQMDGDSVALEIWIDRDRSNAVDESTLSTARSFPWRHGQARIHVHRRHVGIYGHWITTWRPRSASTPELALVLEDDLTVSPFAYRWLRSARRFYADRRDIAGFTLQSEGLIRATDEGPFAPPPASAGAAYLYALMGSWGYAPRPDVWIGFQDWYATVRRGLRPIVPGLIMSTIYKNLERKRKSKTMWTMWFIYYCSQVRGQLYTVYNNIESIAAAVAPSTDGRYICINRREPGLHFSTPATNNILRKLLRTWRPEFEQFSPTLPVFNYNGTQVRVSGI